MKKGFIDAEAQRYVDTYNARRESAPLRAIREKTASLPMAQMLVPLDQGRLMALLAQMVNAKRAIEVGVFTGYSSLCVAEVLPQGGTLIACDVSEEWPAIGKPHWEEAGAAARIDLRLGRAEDTLQQLIANGEGNTFDFAFIDADKEPYPRYYALCLQLLRPGGVLAIDNIFMNGSTLAAEPEGAGSQAIRAVTEQVMDDPAVDAALVPISDGLLIARKR